MLFDKILSTVELLLKLESILSNLDAILSIKFMQYSKIFPAFHEANSVKAWHITRGNEDFLFEKTQFFLQVHQSREPGRDFLKDTSV